MEPIFLIVDLFCGFGGTTTGFVDAEIDGNRIAKVIACVNHDPKAIKSHWLNHPDVKHYEEDIRTLDLTHLKSTVNHWKAIYPNAVLILWASLECTNFSKAKGGQPRDADSRTLAEHLFRYQDALNPEYIKIENVVEFMSWGPLDENGKPLSRKNGQDWMRWRNEMCSYGYYDEWKELNSADFGAYTSRNRLFGCFAKEGYPIIWPEATHSKKGTNTFDMFGGLRKWMPVKDVLDFSDEGESIFNRKKPLSDKTLERIYAGLIKYVAKGDTSFISKYYSGKPSGKNISVEGPAGTVTTVDSQALVNTSFITQRNTGEPESKLVDINGPARTLTATGGNQDLVQPFLLQTYAANSKGHNTFPVDKPARTVTTRDSTQMVLPICLLKYNSTDKTGTHYPPSLENPSPVVVAQNRLGLISGQFLQHYYGNGYVSGTDVPCPTLTTKERVGLVAPEFVKSSQNQSTDEPAGTVMPTDKHTLVQCESFIMPTHFDNKPSSLESPLSTITANRKHHYIVNPSHGGHSTSTEAPCPVIIARQDKAPLYLVQVENGPVAIAVFDCDIEIMLKIKQFMCVFGLVDIKMRMLRVHELLKIQGFPADYQMVGNQSDHKKFIGNSVHPLVPKKWAEAEGKKLLETPKAA